MYPIVRERNKKHSRTCTKSSSTMRNYQNQGWREKKKKKIGGKPMRPNTLLINSFHFLLFSLYFHFSLSLSFLSFIFLSLPLLYLFVSILSLSPSLFVLSLSFFLNILSLRPSATSVLLCSV